MERIFAQSKAAGDTALQGARKSESCGFNLCLDIKPENGTVVYNPAMEHELPPSNNNYIVNPQEHLPNFVSTNGKVNYEDIKQVQELDKKFPKLLEYVSCLTHLAVFGFLGVSLGAECRRE